jgi:hypothetical protein
MSSKDLFATKLASGTALASKMAQWWPKHCHISAELLAACADLRDDVSDIEALAVSTSCEWEVSVPSSKPRRAGSDVGLMVEHTLLEAELVHAVFVNDVKAIGRVADKLLDNAKVQGTRYAHAIPGFPAASFSYLIQEHVELFVEAVRSRFDRNASAAAKCAKAMDDNAVALAAIAVEWF